jgi:hypothetical protein
MPGASAFLNVQFHWGLCLKDAFAPTFRLIVPMDNIIALNIVPRIIKTPAAQMVCGGRINVRK